MALFPLVILIGLIAAFWVLDPLTFFTGSFPPLEELTIQQIHFPEPGQMAIDVINGGPEPVTIAQILVDDAYWQYEIEPGNTLTRLEQATIRLSYPWVDGEPLPVTLITNTGVTFSAEAEAAVQTPQTSPATFFAYGLLVFLFVDTILEALEIAATLPGVMQGTPLVIFGTLFSLGLLLAVSQRQGSTPLAVAGYMALGIGLHNLGEGLAIGAAFATGAAALGSFLVIGFTLHNITE